MTDTKKLTVNGLEVEFTDERNLLEVIRKAGIDLPTFCYHSELSIYGACRLCLVLVEGRGIMAACSTAPAEGMVIHTDTKELRAMRKINIELLLANHDRECTMCPKSATCSLQNIARRLGVHEVRYKAPRHEHPIDKSSPSLDRNPNKCILCGDCVRVCSEIQGIGAINFTNRGSNALVAPAFNNDLGKVECVNCGQCAAVCPTGALTPRDDTDKVWKALYDTSKTVVVQIAPSVRVGLGEMFGCPVGENVAGKLVAALKLMGFKYVYDTNFTADMTIFEEATEFIGRFTKKEKLPLFTSCCPAWVKFAETYFPEFLPNVSSCRSPQGMFGAIAQDILPQQLGCKREDLYVVSIMPCTAKKFECKLPKLATDGKPDVDVVITTSEIGRMIHSMGIDINELEPQAFDMPWGLATGGGVIFGASGGVMEAALRFAVEKITGEKLKDVNFTMVRGMDNRKTATLNVAGNEVKVAVVYGLAAAKKLLNELKSGESYFDFIEVMACPGGCISGGGQPYGADNAIRKQRQDGLYTIDAACELKKSQENYMVDQCYEEHLGGGAGSHKAHELLHTHYQNRSQLFDAKLPIIRGTKDNRLTVTVTIPTKGDNAAATELLGAVSQFVQDSGYMDSVDLDAAFTAENVNCVTVDCEEIAPSIDSVKEAIEKGVKAL